MPVLLIGVAFATFSAFFGTGYLSAKKTIGAFSTTIYGAIVNVVLSIILVPKIGLHGATAGIAAGFFVTWLLRVYQTKKYFDIVFRKSEMTVIMCLVAISSLLIFYVDNLYGLFTFVLIAMGAFVIFNLTLLRKLLVKLIRKKTIS